MLDEMDKNIIREIQSGISICSRPFALIAGKIGITEEEVISRIRNLLEKGAMRKFGAALNHIKAGYDWNAMVVWKVPADRIQETGSIMASFREVSHCYQRPEFPGWPYNLFTMVHGSTREYCEEAIRQIAEASGIKEYKILYSEVEFKKTGALYFIS